MDSAVHLDFRTTQWTRSSKNSREVKFQILHLSVCYRLLLGLHLQLIAVVEEVERFAEQVEPTMVVGQFGFVDPFALEASLVVQSALVGQAVPIDFAEPVVAAVAAFLAVAAFAFAAFATSAIVED